MKKLLLILTVMCLGLSANAITPQELDGKVALQLFYGNRFQGFAHDYDFHNQVDIMPCLSMAGEFRYDAANDQLYIDRFRGHFSLPVKIDDQNRLVMDFSKTLTGDNDYFKKLEIFKVQGNHVDVTYTAFLGDKDDDTILSNGTRYFFEGEMYRVTDETQINENGTDYYAACYIPQSGTTMTSSAYSTQATNGVNLPNFVFNQNSDPMSLAFKLNDSDQNFAIYNAIYIYVMDETNATAEDSNNCKYKLRAKLLDDDVLSFPNLYNMGFRYNLRLNDDASAMDFELSWIQSKLNRENHTLAIDYRRSGGMIRPGYHGYARMRSSNIVKTTNIPTYYYSYSKYYGWQAYIGTTYTNSVIGYDDSFYEYWTGYWYSAAVYELCNQMLASAYDYDGGNNKFTNITGSYDIAKVYHETPHHQWAHHDGGELHTYEDLDITINNSVFYNQAARDIQGGEPLAKYGVESTIEWTNIMANKLDVTHHCEIDQSSLLYGYGEAHNGDTDKYMYISGEVKPLKHTHHMHETPKYEYYLVPGTHTSPSGADFKHENGHVNAINVTDYICNFVGKANVKAKLIAQDDEYVPTAEELNEGTKFNLLVPEKAFGDKATNGQYTLFVKANYETEGLDGTFHALTPLSANVTSVSDLVLDDQNAVITVSNGQIGIEGSNGRAMISTIGGVVVYEGGDATVDVQPGLYIVRAGYQVQRVLVK